MTKYHLFLAIAILFETIATTTLKKTEQFTQLWPTIVFALAMGMSFYMMTLAIKGIPIGIAYAIWSAVGIILISISSYIFYGQKLDSPAVIGMGLIIIGVVIINLFSKVGV